MSALASCDIGSVEQAASLLAQCAEHVATAIAACQRAARATGRWRGPAQQSFDTALCSLQQRLSQTESVHEEAASVIRQYVGALAFAAERARAADAMDRVADALSAQFRRAAAAATSPLSGPDPGQAVRSHAAALRQEAVGQEEIAASLAAAQLDGLAMRAPHVPRFTGTSRFVGDLGQTGIDTVTGTASLLGSAWSSLPGIGSERQRHEARGDLGSSLLAAASVWNIPAEIKDAIEDDRFGLAAGSVLSVVGPGKLSKLAKHPVSRLGKHPIRDMELAHDQALRQTVIDARLAGYEPRGQMPTEMGRHGVVLLNQEKHGGHLIEEHVGQSDAYLHSRLGRIKMASTFLDESSAERLVNQVLALRSHALWDVYLTPVGEFHTVEADFGAVVTGRVMTRGSSHTFPAHGVKVVLGLEGGLPYVHTAYPIP